MMHLNETSSGCNTLAFCCSVTTCYCKLMSLLLTEGKDDGSVSWTQPVRFSLSLRILHCCCWEHWSKIEGWALSQVYDKQEKEQVVGLDNSGSFLGTQDCPQTSSSRSPSQALACYTWTHTHAHTGIPGRGCDKFSWTLKYRGCELTEWLTCLSPMGAAPLQSSIWEALDLSQLLSKLQSHPPPSKEHTLKIQSKKWHITLFLLKESHC